MEAMRNTLTSVIPQNWEVLDSYLTDYRVTQLDLILKTVSPFVDSEANSDLVGRFQTYIDEEENRLAKNLETVSYEIDSTLSLRVIIGPGRIERVWFFFVTLDA